METIDPRQLNEAKHVITFIEDDKGTIHPHLNGVPIPGVVEVEVNWTAQSVRTATIKVLLFDRQFELVPRRTGGPIPGNKWGVVGERGGSDGTITRDADEPRGAILR